MTTRTCRLRAWWSGVVLGLAASLVTSPAPAQVAATARIIDIATDASDPSNLADTEPSIAVNPANPKEIAIVSFSEPWSPTDPTVMAPVWKSRDGGDTWTKVKQIPRPEPNASGPGDQKIAFDANGKLYVAELGFSGGIKDYVYRQTGAPDAPLTPGKSFGDDQPHIDVDPAKSTPFVKKVYTPWLNTNIAKNQSMDDISADGGATETDVNVGDNASFPNRTTRIAVAPDGKAFIVYKTREGAAGTNVETAHFRVKRSDDLGATWNGLPGGGVSVHGPAAVTTFFTTQFGNPAKGKVARARSSDGWIAVAPTSSDVYVAYVNQDASGFGQVFVARSTDHGVTWTSHRATDGTHHSAYPEIAVTSNGAVGLLYIDYDDSGAATLFRHRFAQSFDNGVSWSDQILQSMDPGPLVNASTGFLWGDYNGLTALGKTFYGVFTGASISRTTPQLDPIFFTVSADPCQKLADEVDELEQEISDLLDAFAAGELPPPPRTPQKVAQFMRFIHSLEVKLRNERLALLRCRKANP